MVRNYTDFLKASADALEGSPIPRPFAIWSALSSVAGALGRRVWFPMANYDIRSNLFITLIANPGRNKSVSLILPYSKVLLNLQHL